MSGRLRVELPNQPLQPAVVLACARAQAAERQIVRQTVSAVEDKIDYVQNLWDRIAANQDQIPLQEWHRQILEERLAAHRAAPQDARPWGEVLDGLERRLKTR